MDQQLQCEEEWFDLIVLRTKTLCGRLMDEDGTILELFHLQEEKEVVPLEEVLLEKKLNEEGTLVYKNARALKVRDTFNNILFVL